MGELPVGPELLDITIKIPALPLATWPDSCACSAPSRLLLLPWILANLHARFRCSGEASASGDRLKALVTPVDHVVRICWVALALLLYIGGAFSFHAPSVCDTLDSIWMLHASRHTQFC